MWLILKSYLRRRWVRALVGGAVFVAVIYLQYKLADWPVAVDLADTGKFAPLALQRGQEVVIESPVVNSSEGVLLAYQGKPNEIVHLHFDHARLSDATKKLFTSFGGKPPTAPGAIRFSPEEVKTPTATDAAASVNPCRTFVKTSWEKPDNPPAELKFFQLEMSGPDHVRYLEMQATGGELHVTILPQSETIDGTGARCRHLLRAGDMEEKLGDLAIGIIATSGSAFRWHFRPRGQGVSWKGADDLFQPFTLGQSLVSKANATPPLQARAVKIRSLDAGRSGASAQPESLSARSTDGGPLLGISDLKIGSNQLQLNVSGNGWVKINGVDRSVNLFERFNNLSPLGALLLAALNAALLEGIRRFIFNKPKTADEPSAGA